MEKIKTHILMLSKKFPNTEKDTNFLMKIKKNQKIHTIRQNFEFWCKRIIQVQNFDAVLEIREWSGKPYRSKQNYLMSSTNLDDINYQKLKVIENKESPYGISFIVDNFIHVPIQELARNDGLTVDEFLQWFEPQKNIGKEYIIIHFTHFRYHKDFKENNCLI